MPDTIGSPRGRFGFIGGAGYCTAIATGRCWLMAPQGGQPRAPRTTSIRNASTPFFAISPLDHHEIAGLALSSGFLCFCFVTAIMLCARAAAWAETELAARDEVDRAARPGRPANALLQSEPHRHRLVHHRRGPELIGDPAGDRLARRPGAGVVSWSTRSGAHDRSAVEACGRAAALGFAMTA